MGFLLTAVPAPPTHLKVVSVTDTRAVLQWTPSLGKVDRFIISYESSKSECGNFTLMTNDKALMTEPSVINSPFCHSSECDCNSDAVWKLSGAPAERTAERHPVHNQSPESEGQSTEYGHLNYIYYC